MLRMFTRSLRLIVYQSHTIHQGSYIFHGIQTWCINENWNQNISNYLLKPRKERELKSWRTDQNFQREYRIPLYNTSQWLTAFIFNISNRIILNIMMHSAPNSHIIMQQLIQHGLWHSSQQKASTWPTCLLCNCLSMYICPSVIYPVRSGVGCVISIKQKYKIRDHSALRFENLLSKTEDKIHYFFTIIWHG